eukprot:XP_022273023.1 spidroin-2-like [Canis lupus familiaris]
MRCQQGPLERAAGGRAVQGFGLQAFSKDQSSQPRFSVGTATATATATATHTHTRARAHSASGSATQPSPSRVRGAARRGRPTPGGGPSARGPGQGPRGLARSADSTAREFGRFTMGPPAWPPGSDTPRPGGCAAPVLRGSASGPGRQHPSRAGAPIIIGSVSEIAGRGEFKFRVRWNPPLGILTLDLFHSHGEALPGPSFSSLRSSASPLPNELANSGSDARGLLRGKTIYTTLLCPKGLTGQMETTSSISYQTTKLKEMTSDGTRTQELGSGG